MARLDRNRLDLKLIRGGKKNINWQRIYNIGLLILIAVAYVLFLTGH